LISRENHKVILGLRSKTNGLGSAESPENEKEAVMNIKRIQAWLVMCSLVVLLRPLPGLGQNSDAAKAASQTSPPERDGQHDFDFELGSWKIHLKRLVHPSTGPTTWVEFDGTSVTRKIWDGRAQVEQFETDSSAGGHIEGLTLRLYNPQSHQWRLYWANSKVGILDPPQIGEFKNGLGEFYAQDTIAGKTILIRFIWSNTNTNTPHLEQSFSDDGGKSWQVNWITDQVRVGDEADKTH
jgi:hypothetical protein